MVRCIKLEIPAVGADSVDDPTADADFMQRIGATKQRTGTGGGGGGTLSFAFPAFANRNGNASSSPTYFELQNAVTNTRFTFGWLWHKRSYSSEEVVDGGHGHAHWHCWRLQRMDSLTDRLM